MKNQTVFLFYELKTITYNLSVIVSVVLMNQAHVKQKTESAFQVKMRPVMKFQTIPPKLAVKIVSCNYPILLFAKAKLR